MYLQWTIPIFRELPKLPQCLTDEEKLRLVLITVLGFRKT